MFHVELHQEELSTIEVCFYKLYLNYKLKCILYLYIYFIIIDKLKNINIQFLYLNEKCQIVIFYCIIIV